MPQAMQQNQRNKMTLRIALVALALSVFALLAVGFMLLKPPTELLVETKHQDFIGFAGGGDCSQCSTYNGGKTGCCDNSQCPGTKVCARGGSGCAFYCQYD